MRICLIFLIIFFAVFTGFAQQGYKVMYQHIISFHGTSDTATQTLVFNDSVAYLHHSNTRSKLPAVYKSGDSIFGGERIRHHDVFFLSSENQMVFISQYGKKIKTQYRDAVSLPFTVQQENLLINGMKCQQGYAIKKSGDTIHAIISTDIPYPYGPYCYNGLPGLVIEMYDQEYKYYRKMLAITKGDFEIIFPRRNKDKKKH